MKPRHLFKKWWVIYLPVAFGISITVASAQCLVRVPATEAGHYNSSNYYQIDRGYYLAGQEPMYNRSELRNWFVFSIPGLSRPLERAELRLRAGAVESADGSERFELHQVTTPIAALMNYTGDQAATYRDLGDGPILGSKVISTNDSAQLYREGAWISVPFTPAGLAALTQAQGGTFAAGGAIATLDADLLTRELVFAGRYFPQAPVELLLYLSDPGPPDITVMSGAFSVWRGLGFRWLRRCAERGRCRCNG
jgi:hypothetical protein